MRVTTVAVLAALFGLPGTAALAAAAPAPDGAPEIVARVQAGEIGIAYSAYRGGGRAHYRGGGARGGHYAGRGYAGRGYAGRGYAGRGVYGGRYYGGRAYYGGRGYYGGYGYGYGGAAAAGAAGLAAGALIGGAVASQPVYAAPGGSAVSYCVQRFRSYDPASGTYLGNDGRRHACP